MKLPLFLFLDFYCCAKFEKKLICQVQEKPVTGERTDGQAWIHKTSTPPVVQNRSTPQLPDIWITEWKNGLLFVIFLFRAITCLYFALSMKNYHDNTNKIWKDTVDERVDTVVRKDHIIPLLTLFPPWGKGQILTTLPPFIHTHTHTSRDSYFLNFIRNHLCCDFEILWVLPFTYQRRFCKILW